MKALAIIFICIAIIAVTAIIKGVTVEVPPRAGSVAVTVGGEK